MDIHTPAQGDMTTEVLNLEGFDRRLFDRTPQAILLVDEAGIIVHANLAAEEVFGHESGTLTGRAIESLVPERFRSHHVGLRHQFAEAPSFRMMGSQRDLWGLRQDGKEVPIEVALGPIDWDDRHYVIATVTDISERQRAANELHEANRRLLAMNESQTQREKYLQAVFNGSQSGLVVIDEQGQIVTVNAAALSIFGFTEEELLGQNVDILVPDSIRSGHANLRGSYMRNPVPRMMGTGRDLAGRRKDGTEVFVEVGLREIATPEGRGALASIVDITRRREAEIQTRRYAEQLQDVNQLHEAVLSSTEHLLIATDPDGTVTLFNQASESALGYASTEVVGRQQLDFCFDQAEVTARGRELSEDGTLSSGFEVLTHFPLSEGVETREWTFIRKDGSRFPVQVTMTVIRDGATSIAGYLAVILDISDLYLQRLEVQRVNRELARTNEELARSNRELEQFAYLASHDLQEPLRSIAGPLQLLQRRYEAQLDDSAKTFIEHSVAAADRMQRLIDDLLMYSRAGRHEVPFTPVDINQTLRDVSRSLSATIEESGAEVTWDPLPMVSGNSITLHQLFQNLVGNAVKFRGDSRPKVHVSAVPVDGGKAWEFTVEDNGIGIDPKFFEDIFKVFRRLHSRREYSGTGIGLALCKKIVDMHGGSIWVESESGKGSKFRFKLAASSELKPSGR
ncbi:MAG: PAS domain S-box protein [Armatimonadetes bacterium]|nr:PAS domain S-box protein [Armatimonadota bacterium]